MNLSTPRGTAIVTGGTSGIGRAIVNSLVMNGFGVIATGREEPKDSLGKHVRFIRIEHSTSSSAEELSSQVDDRFGPLMALINNVGRRHNDLIGELHPTTLLETLKLNVVSHMMVTQAMLPLFPSTGGSVINISSRLATVGMPGVSGYSASKGALNSFTMAAAIELAPLNIRVNAVAPGMTKTALIEEWLAEQPDPTIAEAEVVRQIPLGRLATPTDIAVAVTFLASPEAAYLTGIVLPVDGGFTAA